LSEAFAAVGVGLRVRLGMVGIQYPPLPDSNAKFNWPLLAWIAGRLGEGSRGGPWAVPHAGMQRAFGPHFLLSP